MSEEILSEMGSPHERRARPMDISKRALPVEEPEGLTAEYEEEDLAVAPSRPGSRAGHMAADVEYQDTVRSILDDLLSGYVRLLRALEARLLGQTGGQATLGNWSLTDTDYDVAAAVREATSTGLRNGLRNSRSSAPGPSAGLIPLEGRLQRITLMVSPVPRLNQARRLADELERQEMVYRVTLYGFGSEKATFQVETTDPPQFVKYVMSLPRLRARRTAVSADGLEIELSHPLEYGPETKPEEEARPAAPPSKPGANASVAGMGEAASTKAPGPEPAAAAPAPPVRTGRVQMGQPAAPPVGGGAALTVDIDVFFNARHFVVLEGRQGPIHGHAWRVQGRIRGEFGESRAVLMPFAEAKRLLQEAVSRYSDKVLNEVPPFDEVQPTPENVAAVLYKDMSGALSSLPVRLVSVSVWESPTNCVTYSEEDPVGGEQS